MWLGLDDIDGSGGGGADGRRQGGRKNLRPAAVPEPVDQRLRSGDESSQRTNGLTQRPHAHCHAMFYALQFSDAAPRRAEYAGTMRLVDDERGVISFGQIAQIGKRRQVAIHAEYAVGDDESSASRRAVLQSPLQRRQIIVIVELQCVV